jgi:hypothetical protein
MNWNMFDSRHFTTASRSAEGPTASYKTDADCSLTGYEVGVTWVSPFSFILYRGWNCMGQWIFSHLLYWYPYPFSACSHVISGTADTVARKRNYWVWHSSVPHLSKIILLISHSTKMVYPCHNSCLHRLLLYLSL